jgi:hypothetical protein
LKLELKQGTGTVKVSLNNIQETEPGTTVRERIAIGPCEWQATTLSVLQSNREVRMEAIPTKVLKNVAFFKTYSSSMNLPYTVKKS